MVEPMEIEEQSEPDLYDIVDLEWHEWHPGNEGKPKQRIFEANHDSR
jgi:hypothetical protein